MENNNDDKIKINIEYSKQIIHKEIYICLFFLIKKIFIREGNTPYVNEIHKKLDICIDKINEKIIKEKNKHIKSEYSVKNLRNILNFIKMQNKKYAGEIFENILIIVFSMAFKTEKENNFGKYIYNNIGKLKNIKNKELFKWIKKDKLKIDNNFDFSIEEENDPKELKKLPFYDILMKIYEEKNNKIFINKKFQKYLNKGIINIQYNKNNLLKENSFSKYIEILSNMFFSTTLGKYKKNDIKLIRSFFISVYIYYQNKNSPLMKYIKKSEENEELSIIPFVYDLTGAVIEPRFAGIILAPTRIESRITKINLSINKPNANGLIELSKTLLFNKNIKDIILYKTMLKSNYIYFFCDELGLFDNNSVEELNLSNNYLNEESSEYLANMLSHLKNLKTINLSFNDLKGGISSFLILLKNLYRQEKTQLEILILIDCNLNDIAYYELGELLKCKFCKLKKVYLNKNNIPYNVNFLKKLKKNKSLTQIYFNKSNIGNNDTDDIMRIISNANIEYLYLYKNKINNFDECLRIIYRTKLIKTSEEKEKEDIAIEDTCFNNLDLSNNYCINKNINNVKLIIKFINDMTLRCLDISNILCGNNPSIFNSNSYNKEYLKLIGIEESNNDNNGEKENSLKSILIKNQEEYAKIIDKINSNKVDINKLKNKIKNKKLFEGVVKIKEKISEIIKDEKSYYPIYLKEQAKYLLSQTKETKEMIVKDNKFDRQKYDEIHEDLVNYMILKRSEKDLASLKEKKKKIKMIII